MSPDGKILDGFRNIQEILKVKCLTFRKKKPIVDKNKIDLKYLELILCGQ